MASSDEDVSKASRRRGRSRTKSKYKANDDPERRSRRDGASRRSRRDNHSIMEDNEAGDTSSQQQRALSHGIEFVATVQRQATVSRLQLEKVDVNETHSRHRKCR